MAGHGAMQLRQRLECISRIRVRMAGTLFDPLEKGNLSDVQTEDKSCNKGTCSNVGCRVRDLTMAQSAEDSSIADGKARSRSDRRVCN